MTTIFVSLIAKFWPVILGLSGIAGGIVFGWAKTKSANTKVAQAGQKVAEAQTIAAQAQAQEQTAQASNAEAQANAAAAQAGTQATKERSDAESTVDALPAGGAAEQLLNDWARPGEDAGRGAGSAGQDPSH
ncbi:MAG: hypothetical protein OSB38_15095 [Paraburkholderia fungorum]|nr:hypothetical protein [Paraburkholderia fungorum]